MTVPGSAGEDLPEVTHDDEAQRGVLVRVGAAAAHLPPLRTVAADLATRADFDLDSVADLRLAVDEAAAELIAVAARGALLTSTYLVDDDQMQITVSVPTAADVTLRRDTFGWRVLATLVDEVHVVDAAQGDQPQLGIRLCKKRGHPAAEASGR